MTIKIEKNGDHMFAVIDRMNPLDISDYEIKTSAKNGTEVILTFQIDDSVSSIAIEANS